MGGHFRRGWLRLLCNKVSTLAVLSQGVHPPNQNLGRFVIGTRAASRRIGRAFAIADFGGRLKFSGRFAWVLWSTVHLFYLTSLWNRIQVFWDVDLGLFHLSAGRADPDPRQSGRGRHERRAANCSEEAGARSRGAAIRHRSAVDAMIRKVTCCDIRRAWRPAH